MLGAVPLSSDKDLGLKFVDSIAIAQHECDRAISSGGETDAQFAGGGKYGFPNRGGDALVSIRDTRDGRQTDFRERRNFRVMLGPAWIGRGERVDSQFSDGAAMRAYC